MREFKLLLLLIVLSACPLAAQDDAKVLQLLDSLTYVAEMPTTILQTKSIAIIKVPQKPGAQPRNNWKLLAEKAQPGFKKAGIDVVAAYAWEDIYSGKETHTSFLEDFKEREIAHVVFLIFKENSHRIVLTKLPDADQLVLRNQQAWQTENADLSSALKNLYLAAANDSQERQNLLILENPEFGEMTNPINGRRGEYYDLNFSSEKVAVPAFADTAKLKEVMAHYPYDYGLIEADQEEKKLRSEGYQYILYYVHSSGKAVKQMLGYPVNSSETVYISETDAAGDTQVQSYSIHTPVYKFYIKHIYSGNVFLGTTWDAAPSWEEALRNYIKNLRSELVRH